MSTPVSSNEYVIKAICQNVLIDFKQWLMADTKTLQDWKKRPKSIKMCSSRMVDDFDKMLGQFRTKSDDNLLPVLLVAVAKVNMPPDVDKLRAIPYLRNGILPNDEQKRRVKYRLIPSAFRVQIAFVSPDQDSVSSFLNQFCAYMQDDFKRRFDVEYGVAPDLTTTFAMTVFDNSLFPDRTNVEQDNLEVGTVDFTIGGYIPQILGLNIVDTVDNKGNTFYGDHTVMPTERPKLKDILEKLKNGDTVTPYEWDILRQADIETLNKQAIYRVHDSELDDKPSSVDYIEK